MLDHMVVLFLIFKEPAYYFPQWLHQFTFPPNVHKGFLFFTSSPTLVISCLFDNSHSNRCEVIPHHGFKCISLMINILSILSCTCWPTLCLLWKYVYSDSLLMFKIRLFAIVLYEFFIHFGY